MGGKESGTATQDPFPPPAPPWLLPCTYPYVPSPIVSVRLKLLMVRVPQVDEDPSPPLPLPPPPPVPPTTMASSTALRPPVRMSWRSLLCACGDQGVGLGMGGEHAHDGGLPGGERNDPQVDDDDDDFEAGLGWTRGLAQGPAASDRPPRPACRQGAVGGRGGGRVV